MISCLHYSRPDVVQLQQTEKLFSFRIAILRLLNNFAGRPHDVLTAVSS